MRFLHDNGTMLHYEDPLLSDFYFVDPQWLCDMLAHIVTVREINPLVKDGKSSCHLSPLYFSFLLFLPVSPPTSSHPLFQIPSLSPSCPFPPSSHSLISSLPLPAPHFRYPLQPFLSAFFLSLLLPLTSCHISPASHFLSHLSCLTLPVVHF